MRAQLLAVALLAAGAIGVGFAAAPAQAPKRGAVAPKVAAPPRPLLWKVSDADNSIYLLGSFHMLKSTDYPLGGAVDAAFADAEKLVFEFDPAERDSPDLVAKLMAANSLPAGEALRGRIGEKEWARLEAWARERGLDPAAFARFEPWFVGVQVALIDFMRSGFDRDWGVENQMTLRAKKAAKPLGGLEEAFAPIAQLDAMPPAMQQQFLAEALDEAAQFEARSKSLHDLWRSGDAAGFERLTIVEFRRDWPQLYRSLVVDRNNSWMPELQRRLDREASDETLVVVGTLHLVGPDGLVTQLKAKGYRVERM